jgi:hypothetical protein
VEVVHSEHLRRKIALVLPKLDEAIRSLRCPDKAAELYPEHLFLLHTMMRASVPLMEAALARSRANSVWDPVAAQLVTYLNSHIPEEVNHDTWVLEDLEVLGVDRATVLRRSPSPIVAALVGAQYYWIHHYHPVALLGYMEVCEGYPPTDELVEELRLLTGFPGNAFRALFRHARLDPYHCRDLHSVMDALPLESWQSTLIGVSALQTVELVIQAIRRVTEDHRQVVNTGTEQ